MNELIMPKGISSQKCNELNVIYIRLGKELSFAKVFPFSSATVASAATSTEKKIKYVLQCNEIKTVLVYISVLVRANYKI